MAPETPRLRLVGALHTGDPEGVIPFLIKTFPRLVREVKHTGSVARQVQFQSGEGAEDHLHFLGIEVEKIEDIPEGMIAWDLQGDTWTVLESGHGQDQITWQENVCWQWLDQSVDGKLTGEFTAKVPSNWSKTGTSESTAFGISANSYLGIGIEGGSDDNVYLADYDPSWPEKYLEMESRLRKDIGSDVALHIEHYGSTAIPNMPAKPIIDILVEIPSFEEARKRVIPVFNKPECEYWWYKDHMCFIIRDKFMGIRTHHIHMAPAGHRIWDGLKFRDYLRTHPEDASRYAALKRELAEHYRTDRESYTDAKTDFVREVMAREQ
jgi:GrpB-like predicted nucleotidyltransferase (UPF0157 family)/predicted transcriptional regulator YdeE